MSLNNFSDRTIIVCITGGIGSGKTTVANMLKKHGIPIYFADNEAKKLTATSPEIRSELIDLLGKEIYRNGELNRKLMADKIFNDKDLLAKTNAIIHPKVKQHFHDWVEMQKSFYVLKEAAILFESGSYTQCDKTILVVAPEKIRIQRVMSRDGVSEQEVRARMKNQWSDSEKRKLADYVIENIDFQEMEKSVQKLHKLLMSLR